MVGILYTAAVVASAVNAQPAELKESYIKEDSQLCFQVDSCFYRSFGQEVSDNIRAQGSEIFLHYIKGLVNKDLLDKQTASETTDRGLLVTKCNNLRSSGVKEEVYQSICDVCMVLDMQSPDVQDAIFTDFGVEEKTDHTIVYGASVSSSATSYITSDSTGRKTDRTISKRNVETYVATNRSKPYVSALSDIMDVVGYDNTRRNEILKNIADENGVMSRDAAKGLYHKWMDVIESYKDPKQNKKTKTRMKKIKVNESPIKKSERDLKNRFRNDQDAAKRLYNKHEKDAEELFNRKQKELEQEFNDAQKQGEEWFDEQQKQGEDWFNKQQRQGEEWFNQQHGPNKMPGSLGKRHR